MAKAKYTQSKDGKWYAYVWDGTYTATGAKKRKKLSSSKSSGDLEKKKMSMLNQAIILY